MDFNSLLENLIAEELNENKITPQQAKVMEYNAKINYNKAKIANSAAFNKKNNASDVNDDGIISNGAGEINGFNTHEKYEEEHNRTLRRMREKENELLRAKAITTNLNADTEASDEEIITEDLIDSIKRTTKSALTDNNTTIKVGLDKFKLEQAKQEEARRKEEEKQKAQEEKQKKEEEKQNIIDNKQKMIEKRYDKKIDDIKNAADNREEKELNNMKAQKERALDAVKEDIEYSDAKRLLESKGYDLSVDDIDLICEAERIRILPDSKKDETPHNYVSRNIASDLLYNGISGDILRYFITGQSNLSKADKAISDRMSRSPNVSRIVSNIKGELRKVTPDKDRLKTLKMQFRKAYYDISQVIK